jgi:thiamine transport system substrate-binding protein
MSRTIRSGVALAVALGLVAAAAGCGDASPASSTSAPVTLTLVAYDSFPVSGTSLNTALDEFTASTGINVRIVTAGDAGTMVTKAVLTAGNPEGDVMWGVDNTLLSRAVEGKVFEPYAATDLAAVPAGLTGLVPGHEVTPVDVGDVCVNYDIAWFTDHGLTPPATLADLTAPTYRNLLVVENPATSSPGLAFLLATVAQFGTDGWQQYWRDLRANGVEVVDTWDSAYYERFSGSGGGDKPLVVSYGSSPPAEVVFADPPRDDAPTGAVAATCFRQVEFAGVLRGTAHPAQSHQLIDFLLSARFQQELPLNLFVYPARSDVPLPAVFTKFAVVPDRPLTVDPAVIAANRQQWQDEWTQIVLR